MKYSLMVSQRRSFVKYSLDHCGYCHSLGDNRTVYRQWFKVIGSLDLEQGSATARVRFRRSMTLDLFFNDARNIAPIERHYVYIRHGFVTKIDRIYVTEIQSYIARHAEIESPPCSEPQADAYALI